MSAQEGRRKHMWRWSNVSIWWRILSLVVVLNLLLTSVFTWWGYRTQRQLVMDEVNEDLLTGILVLRQYLSENRLDGAFHDRAIDGLEMTDEEFYRTMRPLYDAALEYELAYLYTLVDRDGTVHFVIDSPGRTEVAAGKASDSFLEVYESPPEALARAFEGQRTVFAEYEDEYGEFRSVFVPLRTPGGRAWILGADLLLTEVEDRLTRSLLPPLGAGAVFLMLSLIVAALSIRRVVRPLGRLADTTARIALGDLDVEVPRVGSRDEVGALSDAFENMRRALKDYIADLARTTAEKERIESELKIAHAIQMSFLPRPLAAADRRPEFALEAFLEPAREVGGDLYDYFFVDDDHLFLTVGDVSDKGVPAALLMAVTKTLIKALASPKTLPSDVLGRANRELCEENTEAMFVTVFCGMLDLRTGELRYSNAGHNPPLVIRGPGVAEWLDIPPGLVLGVDPQSDYETRARRLQAGETLLVYTDGVTEAMNPERQLFSEARLEETVRASVGAEPAETVRAVVRATRAFAAGATQSDDITVVALEYRGRLGLSGRRGSTERPRGGPST